MLIENILFLRERFPSIRNYFSEHERDLDLKGYEMIASKSGEMTIRYQDENAERPLMVNSLYNPVQEAERLIAGNQDKIKEQTHVFFYGVGMGYHIEKFVELFPNHSYSVYEPIPEVFLRLSENHQLDKILTKNARNLYVDQHDQETLVYLDEFNTTNENIHLITLPSYKNVVPDKYDQFTKKIKETILNRRSSLHTNASFEKRWVENSLVNFKTVLETPNMLKDIDRSQFEGKPALIVSAGPSLAGDIEHIRYIKENNLAYIFSVGSAINSLIEYDVLPDAVMTYDPGEKNHLVFEKMIEHGIDDIPMVFGSSVGHETIEKYHGPKVHFVTSQDRSSLYFLKEQLNLKNELIIDSPSIAVMTFQILNKLGASPIVFAGQNLGYLYDRLYSEGIEYKHIQSNVDQEKLDNAPTTKDVYGNDIKTNIGFNSMRTSIENFAKVYENNTFINTTKGGAHIEGVPFQSIEDVINNVLTSKVDKLFWYDKKTNYKSKVIDGKMNKLKKDSKEFSNVLDLFNKLMEDIALHTKIKNEAKVLNDLTKFDKLYNKLLDNSYYNDFLSFYTRTQVKYLSNEIKRLNAITNTLEKGRVIVPLFTTFIEQCRQSNVELEKVFKENIANLV